MAADKAYVDYKDELLNLKIDALAIAKGSERVYRCTDNSNGPVTGRPGEFSTNIAMGVTIIQLASTDLNSQPTKVPEVGDILEFDNPQTGDVAKFVVDSLDSYPSIINVTPLGQSSMFFETQTIYTLFTYPQQPEGDFVERPEFEGALD